MKERNPNFNLNIRCFIDEPKQSQKRKHPFFILSTNNHNTQKHFEYLLWNVAQKN